MEAADSAVLTEASTGLNMQDLDCYHPSCGRKPVIDRGMSEPGRCWADSACCRFLNVRSTAGMDAMTRIKHWMYLGLILAGTAVLRVLFRTVRVQHYRIEPDATPYSRPEGSVRYAFPFWHDQIALAIFSLRTWNLSGLISRHRDGGYVADAARIAGIRPVRGSSSRGGAMAVAELLRLPTLHFAMTPDGPRGPRRKLKDGVVFIASRSGRPLVPSGMACSNAWEIRGSWTTLTIPKPFSRTVLIAGTPVSIPQDADREEIAAYMECLAEEMQRLEKLAERILAGDPAAVSEIDRSGEQTWAAVDRNADRQAAA